MLMSTKTSKRLFRYEVSRIHRNLSSVLLDLYQSLESKQTRATMYHVVRAPLKCRRSDNTDVIF